ncbi:hypothetical protein ILT44_21815 [Microvirga sp. BT689]|uniref:hypothetical protein n=1 Tax=Microvirga arvi TaxID=2778731 RepID=UPI001951EFFF|nr:hypothetical protein [Microvirga arvi]MBM6582847.1 hypothetical protein [Microvirga arvi]
MTPATQHQSLIQPAASNAVIENLARRAYEACHPDDSFDALKRRAGFIRPDAGLLRAWMAAARSGRLGPPEEVSAAQAADRPDALAA